VIARPALILGCGPVHLGPQSLLPAVTSVSANLHGQFLLLAVRTVYSIVLNTRDRVSQTTARASLTQMVDTIFQRMQGFGDVRRPPRAARAGALGTAAAGPLTGAATDAPLGPAAQH
jgi:hypothetical protein